MPRIGFAANSGRTRRKGENLLSAYFEGSDSSNRTIVSNCVIWSELIRSNGLVEALRSAWRKLEPDTESRVGQRDQKAKSIEIALMQVHGHKGVAIPRSGAAAVELALLLPVFLMIVWGIIEFGRAMMVSQLVTNGARHGARLSIIDGSTNANVEADVDSFLVSSIGGTLTSTDVAVTFQVFRSGTLIGTDLAAALPRDHITVQVEIDYSKVQLMPSKWLLGSQITGRCTMRHE